MGLLNLGIWNLDIPQASFNDQGLQTVDYEYFDVGGIFLKLQEAN